MPEERSDLQGILWSGPAKSALALTATGLLLVLSVMNIARQASFRPMDDGVLWGEERGRVVALRVEEGGPGHAAGVETGDTLQMITGADAGGTRVVDAAGDVRRVLETVGPEAELRYVLLREGERRGLTLAVQPLPAGNVSLYFFLAGVGIFAAGTGAFVYAFRRRATGAAHFFGLCILWMLAFSFSFTGRLDFFDHVFFWLDRAGVLFFPPVFLHLALSFPLRSRLVDREPRLVRWLYMPSFALLLLSLGARLLYFSPFAPGVWVITGTEALMDRLEPFLWAFYSCGAFAAFVDAYRHARSVTVRKQLRWVVWGTGAGMLPFALIYALPYVGGLTITREMELSLVPMALVPLSFAYAIVKYRLMDVEILFKRGVLVASLMATIAAVYLAAYFLGTSYFGGEEYSLVIAVTSAIIAALLVPSYRGRVERVIDRLFYREHYDFRRALARLAQEMNSQLDLNHLANRLVQGISETFRAERSAVLAGHSAPDARQLAAAASRGLSAAETEAAEALANRPDIRRRLAAGEVVRSPNRVGGVRDGDWVATVVPCLSRDDVVGVIVLGARDTGEPLSSDDVDLLETVAAQAATALVNARLFGSLQSKHREVVVLREQSENTVDSLDAGVVVLDLDGRIVRWNRSMERIDGRARDQVLHSNHAAVFPAALRTALDNGLGPDWLKGGVRGGLSRFNLRGKGGAERIVNVKVAPFVSEDGGHHGSLLIFEDVTERVGMENELQLREKMSSLGVLAAGVAHEVNTPLTGISSFTQMLQEQTESGDPRRPLLSKIERQTERASRIVNGLLNFARHSKVEFEPVNLNRVVNDVLSLLDHQMQRSRIQVRKELDPDLPLVHGDESRLQQVFVNLAVNAFDAMPAGGWLTFTTSAKGGEVVVEVADTGRGIAREDIQRIYDPFFSTKKKTGGNGLGLSISYGIVQEHGGAMEVASHVESGTRFSIRFPEAAKDAAEGVSKERAEAAGSRETGREATA